MTIFEKATLSKSRLLDAAFLVPEVLTSGLPPGTPLVAISVGNRRAPIGLREILARTIVAKYLEESSHAEERKAGISQGVSRQMVY
jgi:hypothetical protein